MSTLGTYSFLPWLRQGIANQITDADDADVHMRAHVDVGLELRGDKLDGGTDTKPVSKPIALAGPGDIVGIDPRAIVRLEPHDWITNFEPNYLAAIEFYDEDFPWRYTPAKADTVRGRLRPWIALAVLKEDEFKPGPPSDPLPSIIVNDAATVFPRPDELWAWAHVHVNRSLGANAAEVISTDVDVIVPRLRAVLNENEDLAYSRLMCPRKLEANTAYHAFVVPVFETGRLAGLKQTIPGDLKATRSAWDPAPGDGLFPYYFRWYFRTGADGDFETLVRLLVPKPVDPRVGRREMDVQHPAPNVRGVDNPDLGGILRLGGALQAPRVDPPDVFDRWDEPYPRPLQTDLAALINLPDDLQVAGHPDPIITPPLYGRWHAMTSRVLTDRNGTPLQPAETWVSRTNLDARYRVAAGLGTRVIQDQQETYMDAAWNQIGDILAAQQRIRYGQFGLLTSTVWYDRHLVTTMNAGTQQGLMLLAPLNKRVLHDGFTIDYLYSQSLVQPTMTSGALRRVVRPRGRLVQQLEFPATNPSSNMLDAVNAGTASAAPPKVTPPGLVTDTGVADAGLSGHVPTWLIGWLRRFRWLPFVSLAIAVLIAIILIAIAPSTPEIGVAVVLVLIGIALMVLLLRWRRLVDGAGTIPLDPIGDGLAQLPPAPNFVIQDPTNTPIPPGKGGSDSADAVRFKRALEQTGHLIGVANAAGAPPVRKPIDLGAIAATAIAGVEPRRTIPRRVFTEVSLPQRIIDDLQQPPAASFVEPMAYPVIDVPMYEPLKNLSAELFLPNINLIAENSITLLQTNEPFIETYLLGLNHEFARELLWREYPTDQRGSTFRQFWDVRGVLNTKNLSPDDFKESLRDVPPLHRWPTNSRLGTNNKRHIEDPNSERLVLVIRGELLKRYPNAVIYAHRACWHRRAVTAADNDLEPCQRSGPIDNTVERRLVILSPDEEASPPPSKVLTPLYEAKVNPDITFFGFDLTLEQARGKDGTQPNDDPGWFFVIKERPGEPRFGLDTDDSGPIQVWSDLSWLVVKPAAQQGIEIETSPASIVLANPGSADEKHEQYLDDRNIVWERDSLNAAQLAYVLFQAPVLVAVHAHEMLPEPT